MKNELDRFGFTQFEKNAIKRRNVERRDTVAAFLLLVLVLAMVLLALSVVYQAFAPSKTFADTASTPISDYCARARIDAIDLRSQRIPENYGAELTKTCGELN